MQVTLNPEHAAFIQTQLNDGNYQTAEDLLGQAIELLKQQQAHEQWLAETRQKVTAGVEALARGEAVDGDVVIAQLHDRLHNAKS